MLCGQKVPDLIGSIETDGFAFLDGDEFNILQPCYPGHHFRNALGHEAGARRLTLGLRGDEDPGSHAGVVECCRTFEDAIVWVEILHQDGVTRSNLLRTHETLSDPQRPEPVG